jgi:hypothetical protein
VNLRRCKTKTNETGVSLDDKSEDHLRLDIMTDIETLGTKQDATIFQISAVAFDIMTGEHISTFNQIADIEKNAIVRVDGSTIKWWLNTNNSHSAPL